MKVRRFSSWTSKPHIAYQLGLEGGTYHTGEGSVIVRTSSNPRVVHTFDSAVSFEKWCKKHPEKIKPKSFMSVWVWQFEYVVEAASMAERDTIQCDGVVVCADEDSRYTRIIERLADI